MSTTILFQKNLLLIVGTLLIPIQPNSTFKQKKTAILLILSWIFRGLMQGGIKILKFQSWNTKKKIQFSLQDQSCSWSYQKALHP